VENITLNKSLKGFKQCWTRNHAVLSYRPGDWQDI